MRANEKSLQQQEAARGPPSATEDASATIRRFLDRLWDSDWPHSTANQPVNDDELLELFAARVSDPAMRQRIGGRIQGPSTTSKMKKRSTESYEMVVKSLDALAPLW